MVALATARQVLLILVFPKDLSAAARQAVRTDSLEVQYPPMHALISLSHLVRLQQALERSKIQPLSDPNIVTGSPRPDIVCTQGFERRPHLERVRERCFGLYQYQAVRVCVGYRRFFLFAVRGGCCGYSISSIPPRFVAKAMAG